jgi:UDPglucose 6-dehydrogenase
MKKPKISVVGLGFVGLTLAVVNAKKGFLTIGIDIDSKKIEDFSSGKPDFFEPKLIEFLQNSIKRKTIQFTTDFNTISKTDITFLTVGTPSSKDGRINLNHVNAAINEIIKVLKKKKKSHLLVIKSTVVPTTTQSQIYPKIKNSKNIQLIVNPEFLRESSAINDLLKPHLIVIGENNQKSAKKLINYYKMFYEKLPEILCTNFSSAELIKYSNNAFLATKISFINSIANICQKIPNADISTISYAIGKDPRIGSLFLNAGPGYGGSCLPKDLSALINFSNIMGDRNSLLKEVKSTNDKQPNRVIELMKKMKVLKKKNIISILGVSFKKDTDDIREAVSIKIVKYLLKNGINVKVHDPLALNNFKTIFRDKIQYCDSISKCLAQSNCCLVLTDWDVYRKLNQRDFQRYMKIPKVIDVRRIFEPENFKDMEFIAIGLG